MTVITRGVGDGFVAALLVLSANPTERLTDRELQILRCIGRGMSNKEIAQDLFISAKTVESHRDHVKQKLELSSSGDLLRYAIEFSRLHV